MTKNKFQQFVEKANEVFIERNELTSGVVWSALTRKPMFVIGKTGTGKSMELRAFASMFEDINYFGIGLHRQRNIEDLFGAIRITKLKQDIYERNVEGFLPTSNILYLDEVFKANTTLLHSTLQVLNEKEMKNGRDTILCPLEVVMTASNEMPENTKELSAVFDRLLLRFEVDYIQEDSNWMKFRQSSEKLREINEKIQRVLLGQEDADFEGVSITLNELKDAQATVRDVEIPNEIYETELQIRKGLRAEGMIVSDRRWADADNVLKARAFMLDRAIVIIDDLSALEHILWHDPKERKKVAEVILDIVNPLMRQANDWYDAVVEAERAFEEAKQKAKKGKEDLTDNVAIELRVNVKKAKAELETIQKTMAKEGRDTTKILAYIHECTKFLKETFLYMAGDAEDDKQTSN